MKNLKTVAFALALGLSGLSVTAAHADSLEPPEQETFNVQSLAAFNGLIIEKIEIHGLKRTRLSALRALLSLNEGDVFNGDRWAEGLHKIYDTTVIYNIKTTATKNNSRLRLDVDVEDRWTLVPYAVARTGGGSEAIGVGIEDVNFLGTFTQVSAGYGTFDRISAYDFNAFNEFIGGNNFVAGIDISQIGIPLQLQNNDRTIAGHSLRGRIQDQLLVGWKWSSSKIRLLNYVEYFRDFLLSDPTGEPVSVLEGWQYRLRPVLVFGRSELTNFLEVGQEITVAPAFANFLNGARSYTQLVVTYKKVLLRGDTNYAFFLNAGAMSSTQIPYRFRLGGFDSVRGYSTDRAVGERYAAANFEFRPYLFRFPTGIAGDAVVQGCLFEDDGFMASANKFGSQDASNLWLISAGGGLRFNFLNFAGAIVRVDLARTIFPDEGIDLSVGVGQLF